MSSLTRFSDFAKYYTNKKFVDQIVTQLLPLLCKYYTTKIKGFFLFFVALEFELRALHLLGRGSTT
jgi:hypothetical protein